MSAYRTMPMLQERTLLLKRCHQNQENSTKVFRDFRSQKNLCRGSMSAHVLHNMTDKFERIGHPGTLSGRGRKWVISTCVENALIATGVMEVFSQSPRGSAVVRALNMPYYTISLLHVMLWNLLFIHTKSIVCDSCSKGTQNIVWYLRSNS